MKRSIYKTTLKPRQSYVSTSEYFRTVVAKCGCNVTLALSETNNQTAKDMIFKAEQNTEICKARATIAAMQIVNKHAK